MAHNNKISPASTTTTTATITDVKETYTEKKRGEKDTK